MTPSVPDLVLGTAQLTNPYGILTRGDRDDASGAAHRLLDAASRFGVVVVDTAPAYGDAESMIGESPHAFTVHTKVSAQRRPRQSVDESLARLRGKPIDVLYLHDPRAIVAGTGLA